MPPRYSLQDSLTLVAQQGLLNAAFEVAEAVALGVWYGADTPDFSKLPGAYRGDAVLLVERLAYYNVVSQERKRELLTLVRAEAPTPPPAAHDNFESAFKRHLPKLQPLQTRHHLE